MMNFNLIRSRFIRRTHYIQTVMAINMFKYVGILFILLTLTACPPEDCTFVTKEATVPGLATIEPLQSIYNVGDEIIYTAIIPSYMIDFGPNNETVDIFQETGVSETMFGGSEIHKFQNNSIDIIEGSIDFINGTMVSNLIYYATDNEYRFKAKITFTETGTYTLQGMNDIPVHFKSDDSYCIQYVIKTSIEGVTANGKIEFIVQ